MKTVTLEEFRAKLREQGGNPLQWKVICPSCGTEQCAQDLIDANAGDTLDEVRAYIGFSCIGRFSEEKGCDWTLGGLFQIHKLEVETPDGKLHPHFELTNLRAEEKENGTS